MVDASPTPRTRQSVTRINGGQGLRLRRAPGVVSDPVDLDMFHEVVIDTLMDAVSQQETMLARTFTKFEGLDDDEGQRSTSTRLFSIKVPAAYTLEERQKQFKALLRSAETRTMMATLIMRATLPSP